MAEIKTVLPKPRIRIDAFGDITPITGNARFVTGDFYDAEQMREAIEAAVLSANAGKVDALLTEADAVCKAYGSISWHHGMGNRVPEDTWLAADTILMRCREAITALRAPSTTQQAIDAKTDAARRYEIVRKLNVPQFAELYRRNIAGEGRFDDLVDQLGQQAIDAGKV